MVNKYDKIYERLQFVLLLWIRFFSFHFTCNWLRDPTFGELLSITNDRNTRTKDDAIFFATRWEKKIIRLSLFCLRNLLAGQNQLFKLIPVKSECHVCVSLTQSFPSGTSIACQVRVTRSNRWPGFQLERPGMQRWWRHKTCWPFADNNNPVFSSQNSVLSQKRRPSDQGLRWGNLERRERGNFAAGLSS